MSSSGVTVTGLEDVLALSTTMNHFQPHPFPRLVTHLSFLHFKPTQEIAVDHNTIIMDNIAGHIIHAIGYTESYY